MNLKPPAVRSPAIACLSLWAASGALHPCAGAEPWHLGVVATSDYVQRGLSHSNNRPALQAGVTYEFGSGVYAGVWGSTVSNARTALRGAAGSSEINYLAGFARPWSDAWEVDVALLRYEYPQSDAPVDYGYTELTASIGYRDRVRFTAATSRDATVFTRRGLGRNITTYALELAGEQPLSAGLSWIAGVGYLEFRDGDLPGYAYFNTGIAGRLAWLNVELQYMDTANGEQLFGRRLAGPRFVLSLLAGF